MQVHHIGYLVKNLEKARASFLALGYLLASDTCRDEYRGVDICFLENGGYCVELVAPFRNDSVVSGLMKTHKNSPYHICYETQNIEDEIAALRRKGYVQIDEPTAAPAIEGRRVCFLLNASSGMIELLETDGIPGDNN